MSAEQEVSLLCKKGWGETAKELWVRCARKSTAPEILSTVAINGKCDNRNVERSVSLGVVLLAPVILPSSSAFLILPFDSRTLPSQLQTITGDSDLSTRWIDDKPSWRVEPFSHLLDVMLLFVGSSIGVFAKNRCEDGRSLGAVSRHRSARMIRKPTNSAALEEVLGD